MATEIQPRVCLVVLVGLPGVGKTTFCNKLNAFLTENESASELKLGLLHVCYDKLLPISTQKEMAWSAKKEDRDPTLVGQLENEENFKSCRKNFVAMTDKIICSFKQRLDIQESDQFTKSIQWQYDNALKKDDVLIVIDDNNYYHSMRYEYFQLARHRTTGFCEIYFKPDNLQTVFFNNSKRLDDEKIPEKVINSMNNRIEPPNPFQNPWEQFSFSISVQSTETNNTMYNLEMCLDVIKAALDNPVEPLPATPPDKTVEAKEQSRKICSTNVYHTSDKILR